MKYFKFILVIFFVLTSLYGKAYVTIVCYTYTIKKVVHTDCFIYNDRKCIDLDYSSTETATCKEIYFVRPTIIKDINSGRCVLLGNSKLYNIAPDELIEISGRSVKSSNTKELESYLSDPNKSYSISESRLQEIAKDLDAKIIVSGTINFKSKENGDILVGCNCCNGLLAVKTEADVEAHAKSCCKTSSASSNLTKIIGGYQKPLIFLGGGITSPGSEIKSQTGIGSLTDLHLGAYIPLKSFNKWSIGIEAGADYGFTNKNSCPDVTPFQVMSQAAPPVINEKGNGSPKAAGFKIAAGSAALFAVNEKFMLLPSFNAVYSSFKESNCIVTQTTQVNGITYNWDIVKRSTGQSSGLGFMPKLKLLYMFGKVGVWAEGNYMLGQKMNTTTSLLVPEGTATNGMYDWGQMEAHTYNSTTGSTAFKGLGFGAGLTINLGLRHRYKFGRDNRVEYGGATGGVVSRTIGTTKCEGYWNDSKKDCSAKSGVCCLKEVIVNSSYNLSALSEIITKSDFTEIRSHIAFSDLKAAIGDAANTKEWINILDGIEKEVLTLEIIPTTKNSVNRAEFLVKQVQNVDKSKKSREGKRADYVGHVTLLR